MDKIWSANAESHANDREKVNVESEVEFQYGDRFRLKT